MAPCATTITERDPWWSVDLLIQQYVLTVVINNTSGLWISFVDGHVNWFVNWFVNWLVEFVEGL